MCFDNADGQKVSDPSVYFLTFPSNSDEWFIPDRSIHVGSAYYDPDSSSQENSIYDDWSYKCAESWKKHMDASHGIVEQQFNFSITPIGVRKLQEKEVLNSKRRKKEGTITPYATFKPDRATEYLKPLELIDSGQCSCSNDTLFLDNSPTLFRDIRAILVPKLVKRKIERVSRKRLKEIDPNINVALEKCLLIVSNLSDTIYNPDYYNKKDKWKHLHSKILHLQTQKGNNFIYKKVLEILKDLNIIEPFIGIEDTEPYVVGVKSKKYRLHPSLWEVGLSQYTITSEEVIENRRAAGNFQSSQAKDNVIYSSLLDFRKYMVLPNESRIKANAKVLIKKGYKKRKKKLTFLNKKARTKKDNSHFSYVEDHIKQFQDMLFSLGPPKVGGSKSGGRVFDFINHIPSHIRSLIKIDGEDCCEVDIACLHPNLANTIYSTGDKHISHDIIASELNLSSRDDAKLDNLMFFNMNLIMMSHMKVYPYYAQHHPKMIENIFDDKRLNGHEITSHKMFSLETKVMTRAIKDLKEKDIIVGYIFDGLLCKVTDAKVVKSILDSALIYYGVNTYSVIKKNKSL